MLRLKVTFIFVFLLLIIFVFTREVGREHVSAEEMGASPINLTLAGHIGGRINKVVTEGNYAYFVTGPKVLIFDISNPTNPQQVGQTSVNPCLVENLTVVGDFLYTANGECGIFIADVSDRSNPQDVGSFKTGVSALDVDVQGNYAYIAGPQSVIPSGIGGLRVVDISDKSFPQEVGAYGAADLGARGVIVSGNNAFVANDIVDGVYIIDITNPTAPVRVGSYSSSNYVFGLDIVENMLFVANRDYGLQIVDVSDPPNPVEIGSYDPPGYTYDVSVRNNYAYLAVVGISGSTNGLITIDITDPTNPVEAGIYDETIVRVEGVSVLGNYAYLADLYRGLRVINVTNPASPTLAGSVDLLGFTEDVSFQGEFAFVAGSARGLVSIDISNPASPVESGFYSPLEGGYFAVDTQAPYAYLAKCCSSEIVEIIDIADPANMSPAGSPITGTLFGNPEEIVVEGNYLYFVKGSAGLKIVDITDLTNPVLTSTFMGNASEGYFQDVNINGNLAYIPDSDGGFLRIVNISDRSNPVEVSSLNIPDSNFNSIAISTNYAYLVNDGTNDTNKMLLIVDITDPEDPVLLNPFPIPSNPNTGGPRDIQVISNLAFVSQGYGGVVVINISNPNAPIEVGRYTKYNASGYSTNSSVQVYGDKVYLADGKSGLYIFDWDANSISEDLDTDKDGLPDKWEIFGYDHDGDGIIDVDLPAMGADPNIKDIFVEIDYFVKIGNHDHRPNPGAIGRVIQVFAENGINLHVDYGPDSLLDLSSGSTWGELSESNMITEKTEYLQQTGEKWDWSGVNRLIYDEGYFKPERWNIFRYVVYAHDLGADQEIGTGGKAYSAPGSVFVVSLGSRDAFEVGVVSSQLEATTFMHELGHILGLCHGGPITLALNEAQCNVDYKPNYLSVMNYSFAIRGLTKFQADGFLDYSHFSGGIVPPLYEKDLNELVGLNAGDELSYFGTRYYCRSLFGWEEKWVPEINQPIDWDCFLGAGGEHVEANINDGDRNNPNSIDDQWMYSYDDWSYLIFDGGGRIGVQGVSPTNSNVLGEQYVNEDDLVIDYENLPFTPYAITIGPNNFIVGNPGIIKTIPIFLTNTGAFTSTISFNINSNSWFNLPEFPANVTLYPDSSLSFDLILDIPDDATTGESQMLKIDALLEEAPLFSDSVNIRVFVGPMALFEATHVTGFAPHNVNFQDVSVGNITSWLWDFGDSTTSSLKNPTHTYIAPGIYSVSLTVSSSEGTNTLIRANLIRIEANNVFLPLVQK